MFVDLLARGYFPIELPPPFQTISLAQALNAAATNVPHPFVYHPNSGQNARTSRAARFSLARAGSLRRTLSIPNPVNYTQLAHVISQNWNDLQIHLQQSNLSLSKPFVNQNNSSRAIQRYKALGDLPEIKSEIRTGRRYLLQTDISTFYSSIYTHSIPWSLHSKVTAKSQRGYNQLLGNKIDTLVRNAQDKQTKGIPIGPDTSLVVAESILTTIDLQLTQAIGRHGFRYVDDYELCFSTYSEAENALSTLQALLTEYELQLNPSKTRILDLPVRIEPKWVSELRRFDFRSNSRALKADLIHYFDCAFDMWNESPDDFILKYTISRSKSAIIDRNNWPLYESLILNGIIAEPGALSVAIDQFKRYSDSGYILGSEKIRETFAEIIAIHAPLGHSSEVAWVLWVSLILNLSIDNQTVNIIKGMTDPIVTLLALDAKSKGLIDLSITFDSWNNLMIRDELYDTNWMIAYEAFDKSWLPSLQTHDYIAQDQPFSFLRNNRVSFYDDQKSLTYTPPPIYPTTYSSGGGGGGISPDDP